MSPLATPRAKFFMSPPFFPKSLCHPSLCHPSKSLCHPFYVTPGMTLKIETGGWSEGRNSTRGFYKAVDSLLRWAEAKNLWPFYQKLYFTILRWAANEENVDSFYSITLLFSIKFLCSRVPSSIKSYLNKVQYQTVSTKKITSLFTHIDD